VSVCTCAPGHPPNAACAVPFHRLDRRAVAYVPVDLTLGGPWKGGNEPDPIAPGTNPGALVAVLYARPATSSGNGGRSRSTTSTGPPTRAALGAVADPDSSVVIFDGDSGQPVLRLVTAERRLT
jgi:hypothetical protein